MCFDDWGNKYVCSNEHGMPLGDLEDEAMAKVLSVAIELSSVEAAEKQLEEETSQKDSALLVMVLVELKWLT